MKSENSSISRTNIHYFSQTSVRWLSSPPSTLQWTRMQLLWWLKWIVQPVDLDYLNSWFFRRFLYCNWVSVYQTDDAIEYEEAMRRTEISNGRQRWFKLTGRKWLILNLHLGRSPNVWSDEMWIKWYFVPESSLLFLLLFFFCSPSHQVFLPLIGCTVTYNILWDHITWN